MLASKFLESVLERSTRKADLVPGSPVQPQQVETHPVSEIERIIIRLRTVLDRTGLSRTTLYRKIGEGTFPRQVPISVNGAGWYESAANRWIADPRGYRETRSERV